MKKYIQLLFIISLAIIQSSCANEDCQDTSLSALFKENGIIFHRPSDNPWIPYQHIKVSTRSSKIKTLGIRDYMGFSFKCDIAPLENTSNLGYSVINVDAFAQKFPNNITV